MIEIVGPVLSGILGAGAAAGIAQYAKDRARSRRWEREEIKLDMQAHMAEMEAKVARYTHLTGAFRLEADRITRELNALAPGRTGALRRSVGGPVRGREYLVVEPGERFVLPPSVSDTPPPKPRRFYASDGDLDRMIDDITVDIRDVVAEVERLCRREAGASEYYRANPHLQYPGHPWLEFVKTGQAAYLGWEATEAENRS